MGLEALWRQRSRRRRKALLTAHSKKRLTAYVVRGVHFNAEFDGVFDNALKSALNSAVNSARSVHFNAEFNSAFIVDCDVESTA